MPTAIHTKSAALRLGFVALADSAPLLLAEHLGLFTAHGLDVRLQREVGWATIRDKIIYGELDAAQAPAGLLAATNCGVSCIPTPCLSALVLNLHGNAITLSRQLREKGVRDGRSLAAHARSREEPLTFGVVHHLSSHHILLRQWLQASGIHPEQGARIVVVPPAQIHRHLAAGNLDGFCVGEPWNSLAVLRKTGWCVATSADLAPGHPEKVVLVTESFAEKRGAEHLALIAALNEACAFCEETANRPYVAEVLAREQFAGTPPEILARSLVGPFVYGDGRNREGSGLHIFSGDRANEPTGDKLRWVLKGLESTGILASGELPSTAASARWFRPDLYRQALRTSAARELSTHSS